MRLIPLTLVSVQPKAPWVTAGPREVISIQLPSLHQAAAAASCQREDERGRLEVDRALFNGRASAAVRTWSQRPAGLNRDAESVLYRGLIEDTLTVTQETGENHFLT